MLNQSFRDTKNAVPMLVCKDYLGDYALKDLISGHDSESTKTSTQMNWGPSTS